MAAIPLAPGSESFAAALCGSWESIRSEVLALDRDDFMPWPLHSAYVGEWRVFPLFLTTWPDELGRRFERNQARCPRTTALLRELGATSAAYSWLAPGCHILPHRDKPEPFVVRTHLGLSCPPGAYLRIGNDWHEWRDGEALSFDGQTEHEVRHLGRTVRITLVADVCTAPNERGPRPAP